MEILRNSKSPETYDFLIKEMFILGAIFFIAAVIFILYGFTFRKKSSEARAIQTTWQEINPAKVAVKFLLFQHGKELLWHQAFIEISKTDEPAFNIKESILSRNSEIYLFPGSYIVKFQMDSLSQTVPLNLQKDLIGSRTSCNAVFE